ncbi:Tripartite tricarboxylate transporter family receptor [compost metagenome]
MDYTYTLWLGLLAPSATPKEVVQKLSDALRHATSSKELDQRFRSEGSDPSHVTPEAFSAYVAQEASEMAKLAADLKLPKE